MHSIVFYIYTVVPILSLVVTDGVTMVSEDTGTLQVCANLENGSLAVPIIVEFNTLPGTAGELDAAISSL